MDKLRIRAYNVLFGDAILITVPDRDLNGEVESRHILIDMGNVLFKGGADQVFKPVMENILDVLDGRPLDLYVMTHEHLDHVQGLLYAECKFHPSGDNALREQLQTRYAWLTASTEEGYYARFPDAEKRHLAFEAAFTEIDSYLEALKASVAAVPGVIEALWVNNNPRKTDCCVDYLRGLAEHTYYVHRDFDPQGKHPFCEASFEIWAPEENTAGYYGELRPVALGVTKPSERRRQKPTLTELTPPSGVDAGAFYNLVDMRRGYVENLLAIDQAANNTSVVFCLEWRGWRLLFAGDAEQLSWQMMHRAGMLGPVHFLKVSHHGSHNGTPDPALLDRILPVSRQDGKPRCALVSTLEGVYNNVPDDATLNLLRDRCDTFYEVHEKALPGGYMDIEFEA